MKLSLKTLSIIVMAAGESTRFCATTSNSNHSEIQTKKQWLRIGTNPLWLAVLESLYEKILPLCCNAPLYELLINESLLDPKNPKQGGVLAALARLEKSEDHSLKQKCYELLKSPFADCVIVTASRRDKFYMEKLAPSRLGIPGIESSLASVGVHVVEGGDSRYASLQNALKIVSADCVIVSDCARCNVSSGVLERLFGAFFDSMAIDCVAPYLPLSDTVALVGEDSRLTHLDRDALRLIQTPQISKTARLIESNKLGVAFSDETSAIAALHDSKVELVVGERSLQKITRGEDLALLEPLLANKDPILDCMLVGQGSDIHAFMESDSKPLYLCGVHIESGKGLRAHSDGDVGLHAVIDSILGAMNCGDIGELFPDTNPEFSGIDSKLLLRKVYDYCLSTGLEIANLDITIIAQEPRVTPYKAQMRECLAHMLCMKQSRISIKASTAENLGFIGRREGILAQCITTLRARTQKY